MMIIPGKFEVNSMGAATYTIPIMVPPGTAGMKPDLSLDYSSNYADGPEGVGWALGGVPTITRCARTIAQDKIHGSVNFDSNDRFCLNGQRLIAINGVYGAANTEYRLEIDTFTKIVSYGQSGNGPTYFMVWTKSGQTLQFGNPAGNPKGTASSAPVVTVSCAAPAPPACTAGTIRSWAVDTVWDTKGNYYRVTYDGGSPDILNGQLYPTNLAYTANDGASLRAYNSVQFVYTTRTDITPTYQAGTELQFTKLLTDIKTYAGSTLVFDYQLGYQTAATAAIAAGFTSASAGAFHDELRTVTQCPASGACLPATTIGWQGGAGLPSMTTNTNYTGFGGDGAGIFSGDFNGDGVTDALSSGCPPLGGPNSQSIWFGTGGGNFVQANMSATYDTGIAKTPTTTNPACFLYGTTLVEAIQPNQVPDIDGDGYSELLLNNTYVNFSTPTIYTDWLLNNQNNNLNQTTLVNGTTFQSNSIPSIAGDFNGDGRMDYFGFTSATGGGCCNNGWVEPITGTAQIFLGNLSNGVWSFTGGQQFIYNSPNAIYQAPLVSDFDGDGCADLLTQGTGTGNAILYSCNPAIPSAPLPNWMPSGFAPSYQFVLGDFNGDGKTDLLLVTDDIQFYPCAGGGHYCAAVNCDASTLYSSTGTGLTPSPFIVPGDWCKYTIVAGDFNGDGKTDIALIPPGDSGNYGPGTPISIWLSIGAGFVQTAMTIANQDQCSHPYSDTEYYPCMGGVVADWNSDGAADLWLEPGNWQSMNNGPDPLYTFAYKPELVTSISNGIGGTTTITYDRLNDSSFYTKGTTAAYPTQDVAGTQYVVQKVQRSNGIGGTYTTAYQYAGARKDLSGRGFLGFSAVTMTDSQNDIVETTNYFTSFPFTGLVASETKVCMSPNCPTSVTLRSTTNCYTTKTNPSNCAAPTAFTLGSGSAARYFVPFRRSIVVSNDQDGSKFPTVTTTNSYDCDTSTNPCYGDVIGIVVNTTDQTTGATLGTKTTTNSYTDDATHWLLGRLLSANIESVVGSSDLVRHTSFCYDLSYAPAGTSCAIGGNSGLLTEEILEPEASDPTLTLETDYTYDAFGNKLTVSTKGCLPVTPPTGSTCPVALTTRTTTMAYDNNAEFPVTVTNALGESETWGTAASPGYDLRFGTPIKHTGPNGLTTNWTYDNLGHQATETRPDGTSTSAFYYYCLGVNGGSDATCPSHGAFSAYVSVFGTDGSTQIAPQTRSYFDSLSRGLASDVQGFNACWIRQDTQYDSKGRISQTNRPYFLGGTGCTAQTPEWTVTSYVISSGIQDALGRARKVTNPDGGYDLYTWSGLTTTVTEHVKGPGSTTKNELTTTLKNAQGLVATVTDALSHATNYVYDAFGNVLTVGDPAGNVTTNIYDIRGRKSSAADPDMGTWTYNYDSFGELYRQSDAKSQIVSLSYDLLGRVTQRAEPDMTSNWTFGTTGNQTNYPHSIDRLVVATCTPVGSSTSCVANYARDYFYDATGRPSALQIFLETYNFSTATSYDSISGKSSAVQTFSGFTTKNIYNSTGYLCQIVDSASTNSNCSGTNLVYWQGNSRDAEQHPTSQTSGGVLTTTQAFDPLSGRVTSIQAGTGNGVANFSYSWDTASDLVQRTDANAIAGGLTENFCYDALNRLTNYANGATSSSCATGTVVKSVAYDALGDILTKSDVGTYSYGVGVRPHAVTSIDTTTGCSPGPCTVNGATNPSFAYDANGSMMSGAGRTVAPTSFNMAGQIAESTPNSATYTLSYDSEHGRIRQAYAGSGTFYLNDPADGVMTEHYKKNGVVTWRDYILVDGKPMAERFSQAGTVTMEYFVLDHLGSTAVVTDATGTPLSSYGRLAYDAWGKARNLDGTDDTACAAFPPISATATTRGFTGHEEMTAICLVNANARIYDPQLGRFMSADDYIADAFNLQSLNHYTYVENGPLSFTDPTGRISTGGPGEPNPPPPPPWAGLPFGGACRCAALGSAVIGTDSSGNVVYVGDNNLLLKNQSVDGIGSAASSTTTTTAVNGVGNSVASGANAGEQDSANPHTVEPVDEGASQAQALANDNAVTNGSFAPPVLEDTPSGSCTPGCGEIKDLGPAVPDKVDTNGAGCPGCMQVAENGIPQVTLNRLQGIRAEDQAESELIGQGFTVVRYVSFRDPATNRTAIIDMVAHQDFESPNSSTGKTSVYVFEEVKSGNGQLTVNQAAVATALQNGTAIPIGPNARAVGLIPGEPTGPQVGPVFLVTQGYQGL